MGSDADASMDVDEERNGEERERSVSKEEAVKEEPVQREKGESKKRPHEDGERHVSKKSSKSAVKEEDGSHSESQQQSKKEGKDSKSKAIVKRDVPYSKSNELAFPKGKVKSIMKLADNDMGQMGAEAISLVAKASECFLEKLCMDSFHVAELAGRRILKYQDISDTRIANPNLVFLEQIVPPPAGRRT